MVRKDDGFSFGHLPLRWLKNIEVFVHYRKAIRYLCLELRNLVFRYTFGHHQGVEMFETTGWDYLPGREQNRKRAKG